MSKKVTLSPDFLQVIKNAAFELSVAEETKSRKEWLIATTTNEEWEENKAYYEGNQINNEYFNILTSKAINEVAGFALITETGNTLKMWREVVAQFENVSDDLKKLPFDYFRKARTLWNMSEHGETIQHITYPIAPIAEAIANQWTAKEMYESYTDPVVVVRNIQARDKWTTEKRQAQLYNADMLKVREQRDALKTENERLQRIEQAARFVVMSASPFIEDMIGIASSARTAKKDIEELLSALGS